MPPTSSLDRVTTCSFHEEGRRLSRCLTRMWLARTLRAGRGSLPSPGKQGPLNTAYVAGRGAAEPPADPPWTVNSTKPSLPPKWTTMPSLSSVGLWPATLQGVPRQEDAHRIAVDGSRCPARLVPFREVPCVDLRSMRYGLPFSW